MLKSTFISTVTENWKQIFTEKEFLILEKIESKINIAKCCPNISHVFRALSFFEPEDTKVIIIGQDPYHTMKKGIKIADGLCFSTKSTGYIPGSLRNIFKELKSNYNLTRTNTDLSDCRVNTDLSDCRVNTDLSDWAQQGILLLNTLLTTSTGVALAHNNIHWKGHCAWKLITQKILNESVSRSTPVIVLLGNYAKNYKNSLKKINPELIFIESVHPSPLSANRGFHGSRIFIKINDALMSMSKDPILWG